VTYSASSSGTRTHCARHCCWSNLVAVHVRIPASARGTTNGLAGGQGHDSKKIIAAMLALYVAFACAVIQVDARQFNMQVLALRARDHTAARLYPKTLRASQSAPALVTPPVFRSPTLQSDAVHRPTLQSHQVETNVSTLRTTHVPLIVSPRCAPQVVAARTARELVFSHRDFGVGIHRWPPWKLRFWCCTQPTSAMPSLSPKMSRMTLPCFASWRSKAIVPRHTIPGQDPRALPGSRA
jgi:hypothetical protein